MPLVAVGPVVGCVVPSEARFRRRSGQESHRYRVVFAGEHRGQRSVGDGSTAVAFDCPDTRAHLCLTTADREGLAFPAVHARLLMHTIPGEARRRSVALHWPHHLDGSGLIDAPSRV